MRKVPEEVFVQQILERQKWRKRTILTGQSYAMVAVVSGRACNECKEECRSDYDDSG